MNKCSKQLLLPLVLLAAVWTTPLQAQEAVEPKKSPMALVSHVSGDNFLSITYSQPHMRERKIFGGLVPYGEIWRLGANEATQMTLTDDVMFAGSELEEGTYTLFAIPEEEQWTIVVNSKLGQWGAYAYDSEMDVMRVSVPVSETEETWEPFTIRINEMEDKPEFGIQMMWEDTMVEIPVMFEQD